LFNQEQPAV